MIRSVKIARGLRLVILSACCLVLAGLPRAVSGGAEPPDAGALVVGLDVVRASVPADRPFVTPRNSRHSASGWYLGAGRILTSYDVIRDAVSVQVRLPNGERKAAEVQHLAADAGLAVLLTSTEYAPKGVSPKGDPVVPTGAIVDIYGRDTTARLRRLRVSGVVDRHLARSDVDRRRLFLLEDDRDESSRHFEGGPVYHEGHFLGIYHRGDVSYVLPRNLVRHVIKDIADATYGGFPDTGLLTQRIRSKVHRGVAGLKEGENGILVRRVLYESGAWGRLRTGDVLLSVNGVPFGADGRLAIAAGSRSLEQYVAALQAGVVVSRVRRGDSDAEVRFRVDSYRGYRWKRSRPRDQRVYLVRAGLVFQELDYDLLHYSAAGKSRLLRYRYTYFHEDGLAEQVDRDVVLTAVLPHQETAGAESLRFGVLEYVNKRRIRSLRHLAETLKSNQARFITLRFLGERVPIVLEAAKIPKIDDWVFSRYRVRPGGTLEVQNR